MALVSAVERGVRTGTGAYLLSTSVRSCKTAVVTHLARHSHQDSRNNRCSRSPKVLSLTRLDISSFRLWARIGQGVMAVNRESSQARDFVVVQAEGVGEVGQAT